MCHEDERGAAAAARSSNNAEELVGNSMADEAVENGCAKVAPFWTKVTDAGIREAIAFMVSKRLAVFQAHIWR